MAGDATGEESGSGGEVSAPVWEPEAPPDHVTDHLDIWDFGPEPLCTGRVADLESEAARLSAEMGLTVERLAVLYGSNAVDQFCDAPFPVAGCVNGAGVETYVATTAGSASHEFVHAIRGQHHLRTHAFFEEGIAEHLGANRPSGVYYTWQPPSLDDFGPAVLLDYSAADFYAGNMTYGDFYTLAAHFVTYLRETHGTDPLMSFLREAGTDGIEDAFVEAFGDTISESEAQWRRDAPESYELENLCHEVLDLGPEGITIEQLMSCEEPGTTGPGLSGMFEDRKGYCFDVEAPSTVVVTADIDGGFVALSAVGCENATGPGTSVRDGNPEVLTLAACRWKVSLRTHAPEALASVSIVPN